MIFCNEQLLQRVTSNFLQQATSATSGERISQQVTSDFTLSNEQRVNFNEQRATREKLHLITHPVHRIFQIVLRGGGNPPSEGMGNFCGGLFYQVVGV